MVITRFFKRNRAKTPLHFFIGRRYPRRLRRAAENIIPPAAKAAVTASGEAEEPHPPATFSEPLSDPADGALTAVVENVAAFGEQIVVKATSRDNAEAYATCTVEYLQRTTGYTFNLDGKALSENGAENLVQLDFMESKSAAVQISVNKSTVYTRANTDKAEYFKIKPALAFGGVITASGAKSEDLKEYSGGASATLTGFFDKTWGEALHKANNTIKNKLITNISTYTGADAYTVEIYDAEGGKLLETYGLRLDTSKIVTQKGVESIEIDETEIVF